jgi:hypothetical protein
MPAFDPNPPRRVVSEHPGPGTGETIYTDEYGQRWVTEFCGQADGIVTPAQVRVRRT